MSTLTRELLVIGGNSGIGRELLERMHRAGGWRLHAALRQPGEAPPGLCATTQAWDAEDATARLSLPETLHGVVYLPGTISLKPFHRLGPDDFHRDLQVNLHGAVHVLQQALPALKRAGEAGASVVLFSSVAVGIGMPFHASIAAAKAAVEGLGRSLAAEWAPRIRVNVIAPSLTDTPLASGLLAGDGRAEGAAQRHPLRRIGEPREVASLAAWLLGEESGFVTGQVLPVDGGLSSLRLF